MTEDAKTKTYGALECDTRNGTPQRDASETWTHSTRNNDVAPEKTHKMEKYGL